MHSFNAVANTVRVPLEGLVDWLFGCSHRRKSFPITLRTRHGAEGQQSTEAETYVVCLECGRQFPYDWTTMRMTAHAGIERPHERNI